jgi:FKBP-type peptidyl-prolyl cis-trans isomerase
MKKSIFLWSMMSIALPFIIFSCMDTSEPPTRDFDQQYQQGLAAVDKTQLAIDKKAIDDSLANWGVSGVVKDTTGVRYTVEALGTGAMPLLSSRILAKYEGRFLKDSLDGPTFDAGELAGQYYLGDLILGWQATLPKFPVGSKVTLYIPSGLGYGKNDVKNQNTGDIVIPKNSNLIFKIELKGIL